MLNETENMRLTRVGPGTPMGDLLRRYWHPVAAVSDLANAWTKRVRLLGEDLVLFKDRQGRYGLVDEYCPHRSASLAYGIPTKEGIRCPYHGWHFDRSGRCLEQPNELQSARAGRGETQLEPFRTTAYPLQELGGMFFAYLGPAPAPLLPRFDAFVVENGIRMIGRATVPCNWLQIMENSADPVHTEWLHGHMQEFVEGNEEAKYSITKQHVRIAFDEFEFGLIKRRLLYGQTEDCDDWQVGHPIVFPTILAVGNGDSSTWQMYAFQIRVPMDDTHTMHIWYTTYVPPPSTPVRPELYANVSVYDVPFKNDRGEYLLDLIDAQDILAWVTQGEIADRTKEKLVQTDMGVVRFRRMLQRELKKVERGEDPLGTVRDPARNVIINLPIEKDKAHFMDGFASLVARTQARYSPIKEELLKIFAETGKPKAGSRVLERA